MPWSPFLTLSVTPGSSHPGCAWTRPGELVVMWSTIGEYRAQVYGLLEDGALSLVQDGITLLKHGAITGVFGAGGECVFVTTDDQNVLYNADLELLLKTIDSRIFVYGTQIFGVRDHQVIDHGSIFDPNASGNIVRRIPDDGSGNMGDVVAGYNGLWFPRVRDGRTGYYFMQITGGELASAQYVSGNFSTPQGYGQRPECAPQVLVAGVPRVLTPNGEIPLVSATPPSGMSTFVPALDIGVFTPGQ